MTDVGADYSRPEEFRRRRLFLLWGETLIGLVFLAQVARWILWTCSAELPFDDGDFAAALPVALRFDVMIAAWLATPVLLAAAVSSFVGEKSRRRLAIWAARWRTSAWVFAGWLGLVNFGFFGEYRDQFNRTVFGAVDDDSVAIAKTIFHDFHWGRYLFAAALLAVVVACVAKYDVSARLSRRMTAGRGRVFGAVALVAAAGLAAGCYRGGYGSRPPQQKDAYVCRADAANRLVPNPVFLLRMAYKERRALADPSANPAFLRDVRAQAVVLGGPEARTASRISEALRREVMKKRSSAPRPPRRVYLIVMESYDRWPMTPPYEAIGLTPALSRMERDGAGADVFVSAGSGTMPSFATLVTGLPFNGAPQNYQKSSARPFPTSLAPIFKRLGYKTRFVYGGYGSWQRIGDFVREQGFDEVVTGSRIPCDESDRGEWGVPDGALFKHLDALDAQADAPVFTLVLSTSYHPPYLLDLARLGHAEATMPEALKDRYDGTHAMRVFSHLKYADAALGEFVASTLARDPEALFAVTGDHWSRKFLNTTPTLAERKCVPFVLYGPAHVPAGTRLAPGGHPDILPTLLGLCAPEGFSYAAFGEDLFGAPHRPGIEGNGAIVHADGLFLSEDPGCREGAPLPEDRVREALAYAEAQTALSWWLLMRGDDLPPVAVP